MSLIPTKSNEVTGLIFAHSNAAAFRYIPMLSNEVVFNCEFNFHPEQGNFVQPQTHFLPKQRNCDQPRVCFTPCFTQSAAWSNVGGVVEWLKRRA